MSVMNADRFRYPLVYSGLPSLARRSYERNHSIDDGIHGRAACGIVLGARSQGLGKLTNFLLTRPRLRHQPVNLFHSRLRDYQVSGKGPNQSALHWILYVQIGYRHNTPNCKPTTSKMRQFICQGWGPLKIHGSLGTF